MCVPAADWESGSVLIHCYNLRDILTLASPSSQLFCENSHQSRTVTSVVVGSTFTEVVFSVPLNFIKCSVRPFVLFCDIVTYSTLLNLENYF